MGLREAMVRLQRPAPIAWVRHKSNPSTFSFPALTQDRGNNQASYGSNLGCGNWALKPPLFFYSDLKSFSHFVYWFQTDPKCTAFPVGIGRIVNAVHSSRLVLQVKVIPSPHSKIMCKWVRGAKAGPMRGAGEQSWMATQKALLSVKQQSHSLSTSGMRRCSSWQGDSSHCPQTSTGAFNGAGLCSKTMSFEQTAKRERATSRQIW